MRQDTQRCKDNEGRQREHAWYHDIYLGQLPEVCLSNSEAPLRNVAHRRISLTQARSIIFVGHNQGIHGIMELINARGQ